MDLSISMIGLSPQAYYFLVSNGIKSVAFLREFTEQELLSLKMSFSSFQSLEERRKIVEEIMNKLKELENVECFKRMPLEAKIKELHLEGRGEYRLQVNGVYTVGKLATLSERNILNMHAIGAKTLDEIKDSLRDVEGFSFELSEEDMVCLGMTDNERVFYQEQKELVEKADFERKQQKKFDEQKRREYVTNRNIVLGYLIARLGIPEPIFADGSDDIDTAKLTLKDLLVYLSYKKVINSKEIMMGFKKLNIPGLYLGMSRREIDELKVSSLKMEEIIALIKSEELRRDEESFMRSRFLEEDNQRRQVILQEQVHSHNEALRLQATLKEEMIQKLEALLEENQRLKDINQSLDSKIAELSSKLGISTTSKAGDDNYGK